MARYYLLINELSGASRNVAATEIVEPRYKWAGNLFILQAPGPFQRREE